MTTQDFAETIKAKYPTYQGMDNNDLVQKIVAKYPVYAKQINDLQQPAQAPQPTAQQDTGVNPLDTYTPEQVAPKPDTSTPAPQPAQDQGGYFRQVGEGISNAVSDTLSNFHQAKDVLNSAFNPNEATVNTSEGEQVVPINSLPDDVKQQTGLDTTLGRAANTAGSVISGVLGEAGSVAGGIGQAAMSVVNPFLHPAIKEAVSSLSPETQKSIGDISNAVQQLAIQNPQIAKAIKLGLDVTALKGTGEIAQGIGNIGAGVAAGIKGGAEDIPSVADRLVGQTGQVVKGAGQAVSDIAKGTAQATAGAGQVASDIAAGSEPAAPGIASKALGAAKDIATNPTAQKIALVAAGGGALAAGATYLNEKNPQLGDLIKAGESIYS